MTLVTIFLSAILCVLLLTLAIQHGTQNTRESVLRSRRDFDHGSRASFSQTLPIRANGEPSHHLPSSDDDEDGHMYHQIAEEDEVQVTPFPGGLNSRSGDTTPSVAGIIVSANDNMDIETQSPLLRQLPRARESDDPRPEGSTNDEDESGDDEETRMSPVNSPPSYLSPAPSISYENAAQITQLFLSHLQHDTAEIVLENGHQRYQTPPPTPESWSGESTPPYINVLPSDNVMQVTRPPIMNRASYSIRRQLDVHETVMQVAEILREHLEYGQENTFGNPRRRRLRDESTHEEIAEDGETTSEYAQCVRSLKTVLKALSSTTVASNRSVREICGELCTISEDLKGRIKDLLNLLFNDHDLSYDEYDDLLLYLENISKKFGKAVSTISPINRQITNLQEEGDLWTVHVLSEIQEHIKFFESVIPVLVDSLRYAFMYNKTGVFDNVTRSEVETLRQHAKYTKSIIKTLLKSLVTAQRRIMWANKLKKVNVWSNINRRKMDKKCCICLEDKIVPEGDYALLNSCEHLFHVGCFHEWFTGLSFRYKCPLCKGSVAAWITVEDCTEYGRDDP